MPTGRADTPTRKHCCRRAGWATGRVETDEVRQFNFELSEFPYAAKRDFCQPHI
jgi:hypothetical protein